MPETPGNPNRFYVIAGWDDAPHLSEKMKAKMAASIEPHLRNARMKGLPSMGSGLIFPIEEEEIMVADFEIPKHYVRCFGMDTGWRFTAGIWLAKNLETQITYLYDCYKASEQPPPMHAYAFKERGEWIPGAGDCADINKMDGEQFLKTYRKLGLDVDLPDKRSKEANIQEVWIALCTGKLKVFKSCVKWLEEFRLYRRDEKGSIVKTNDHLMDATQYGMKTGIPRAITKPVPVEPYRQTQPVEGLGGWMR